jgi:glutathione S-transferase
MSKLTIYGTAASRAFRTLWMANELGLDYDHQPIDFRTGETSTEEYLRINPNGRLPAIRDGDFVLWESLAINLYLARKHPGPLTPQTVEDEGRAAQWSLWALGEVEPHVIMVLMNTLFLPEPKRNAAAAESAIATLDKPLAVLDGALKDSTWLLGTDFTVADINVAGVLSPAPRGNIDFSAYPAVKTWLDSCLARPAAVAARTLAREAMAAR